MNKTFTDLHNQTLTLGEHIEQMREAYEALERERDALVADNNRLREALNAMVKAFMPSEGSGANSLGVDDVTVEACVALTETPAQPPQPHQSAGGGGDDRAR